METTIRPRRDFKALEDRRMEAAKWFRRGRPQAYVVKLLEVSRQTASRWYGAWKRRGAPGMKGAGRAGRLPRLDDAARDRLTKALRKGAGTWGFTTHLWTMERIARVIKRVCGVTYHPRHVGRIMRSLGWSRQRPVRRAAERDEAAIAEWCKYRWVEIKKNSAA